MIPLACAHCISSDVSSRDGWSVREGECFFSAWETAVGFCQGCDSYGTVFETVISDSWSACFCSSEETVGYSTASDHVGYRQDSPCIRCWILELGFEVE